MDKMFDLRNQIGDGKYSLKLEIAEDAYFDIYDNVDNNAGEDVVRNYLLSHGDDARFNNLDIKHDKSKRVVTLTAELNYYENDHTSYPNRNKLM